MWFQPMGKGSYYSDECGPGGNGQCDGYDCDCLCHEEEYAPTEETVSAYAQWHVNTWSEYTNDTRPRKV